MPSGSLLCFLISILPPNNLALVGQPAGCEVVNFFSVITGTQSCRVFLIIYKNDRLFNGSWYKFNEFNRADAINILQLPGKYKKYLSENR
jgi:hypothetical protein